MCGRFTLRLTPAELAEIFRLLDEPEFSPRYNIAPTQTVPIVRKGETAFEAVPMRWGLIPSWAKDAKIGNRLINARGETVAEKPSFRAAFKRRRCLVPADGFYEWKKLDAKTKQPYMIGLKNADPFAFAGLWETWKSPEEERSESFTIITTSANDFLSDLHNRMPVILHEEDYDRWLDEKNDDYENLQELLTSYPGDAMRTYPVSTVVNSPRNDRAECAEELKEGDGTLFG